jgi:dephospho-CoA kinase
MAVTHPAIGRLLRQRFAEAEQSGARIIVYESALLVENGVASAWRPLVVVRTTRELQIFRLARRSGLTPKEAEDRIRSQMSVDEKARHADFVIDNSGTEADVEERFVSVFAELMRLAQT